MKDVINAYGLTGNMGCGKSTVAEFLKKHSDVCVMDCDQIAKEILFDIKNRPKIKEIFGKEIIENELVDEKKVAEIIFKNLIKKQKLESFIHPKVWQEVREKTENGPKNIIYIVESALIFETKMENNFKGIILVICDKDEQFKRIKKRNKWTDEQIKERLKNQLSDKYKNKNVLIKIDTQCLIKELESKVEEVYSFIKTQKR